MTLMIQQRSCLLQTVSVHTSYCKEYTQKDRLVSFSFFIFFKKKICSIFNL